MTNFEKYKNEIKKIVDDNEYVAVVNGKPVKCFGTTCKKCDFVKKENSCTWNAMEWACEEYDEREIDLPNDIKVDTPILVSNDGEEWHRRYFSKIEKGIVYAWLDGKTSWSSNYMATTWKYAKLPEE